MLNGLMIDIDKSKRYYLNDELHREDGPAIELINGNKFWYLNGKRHREDGPAIEQGNNTKFWFVNDKQIEHPEEFKTMEEFFQHLNDDEVYSLQLISDFNWVIGFIKNPTGKQTRLHAMRWKI